MSNNTNTGKTVMLFLIPLVLLGIVMYVLLSGGIADILKNDLPPVEELHVMRHTMLKDKIVLDVLNSGPDPTDIAQVMVRGAFWYHEVVQPGSDNPRHIEPLSSVQVVIPFPWNEAEPVAIGLLTGSGLVFDYEIEVASISPVADAAAYGRFALLGAYVGVIPVLLGICWFPFLRRLSRQSLDFLLYLTVGLLGYLVLDSVLEALEAAAELPGVYHGEALVALGLVGTYLLLMGITSKSDNKGSQSTASSGPVLAWTIALGIGLHNLGEGLAIGSAYVLGEVTLGAMLIVGFTLHNITEGIAIVSPILEEKGSQIGRLIGLGLLGGVPTIFGCWIGAFTFSHVWAVLFLGIGAGAILQVIGAIIGNRPMKETVAPLNLVGLLVGFMIMYGTAYLV